MPNCSPKKPSHQQSVRVPVSSYPPQQRTLSTFLFFFLKASIYCLAGMAHKKIKSGEKKAERLGTSKPKEQQDDGEFPEFSFCFPHPRLESEVSRLDTKAQTKQKKSKQNKTAHNKNLLSLANGPGKGSLTREKTWKITALCQPNTTEELWPHPHPTTPVLSLDFHSSQDIMRHPNSPGWFPRRSSREGELSPPTPPPLHQLGIRPPTPQGQ